MILKITKDKINVFEKSLDLEDYKGYIQIQNCFKIEIDVKPVLSLILKDENKEIILILHPDKIEIEGGEIK